MRVRDKEIGREREIKDRERKRELEESERKRDRGSERER